MILTARQKKAGEVNISITTISIKIVYREYVQLSMYVSVPK